MKTVELLGEYNTTFGLTLIVLCDAPISKNDIITTDGKKSFKVKQVILPTRPMEDDRLSVIVERIA